MNDSIDSLAADILASAMPDGLRLAKRAEALWSEIQSENIALRSELGRAKTRIRNKDAKIRELERQLADFKKRVFGASADRNPNKDQLQKGDDASGQLSPEDTPNSPTEDSGRELHERIETLKAPTPRNRKGRGKRKFPKELERREIYMGTADKKCPCGCGGSILGYDINETLEMVPARYYLAVRKYPNTAAVQ
jgi:transposase